MFAALTCCAPSSLSGSIPSLSYLFSGMFIGPTSDTRVDDRDEPCMNWRSPSADAGRTGEPAWLVDRLMRNLLVDIPVIPTARVLYRQAVLAGYGFRPSGAFQAAV